MSKASVYEAKTESFIQPILDSMNFELVDVEYVKEGGVNYLRAPYRYMLSGSSRRLP